MSIAARLISHIHLRQSGLDVPHRNDGKQNGSWLVRLLPVSVVAQLLRHGPRRFATALFSDGGKQDGENTEQSAVACSWLPARNAGMPSEVKQKVRTGFARARVKLAVSTVAFGMGHADEASLTRLRPPLSVDCGYGTSSPRWSNEEGSSGSTFIH
ncbi:hypothetical protein PsorP6_005065 [Peronosclerospora sorghi]|uniref:Uncharacterized protein n=1 Tax=Peronosclerospora sorghi TaxID=230839 RepID=A0ACC0W5N1_9STRA|nr:hypothetical protein PsorP6_005065 [Peronosclerospora sorghi]